MEGVSQFDNERVVDKRENLLFCLNIAIEVGAEHSFFANCFESKKGILPFLFDQINLSKCTLADPFVELKTAESDVLDFMMSFDELVHFVDVSLS